MTREQLLILLIEECGEVIQAATKCLRFGWDHEYKDYGVNHVELAGEIGDVLGVMGALYSDLPPEIIRRRAERKIARAASYE